MTNSSFLNHILESVVNEDRNIKMDVIGDSAENLLEKLVEDSIDTSLIQGIIVKNLFFKYFYLYRLTGGGKFARFRS